MNTRMNLKWRKDVIALAVQRAFQVFPLTVELCEALTFLAPLACHEEKSFIALSRIAALPVETEVKDLADLEKNRCETLLHLTAATAKYV